MNHSDLNEQRLTNGSGFPATAHQRHEGHAHMSPLGRLYQLLRPDRIDIAIVAIFAVVVATLGLATPVAVEALVNTVAFGRLLQPLIVLCGILLAFLGFAAALTSLQAYLAEVLQRRIFVRVVADLANRLPRVKKSALDECHGPELMNRFFDVMTVQKSSALLVLDGVSLVLQTVMGMILLGFYHPLLLGFDAMLLASIATIVFWLGRGAVPTAIQESLAKYQVAGWLEQLAQHPIMFKSGKWPRQAAEFADHLTGEYLKARKRHFRILMRQVLFSLGLQAVAGSLLLGLGGWLVINGQLTLGQLVAAELVVAVIVGSFAKLGKHLESFYDLLAAVDKLGHLFDLPTEKFDGNELPLSSQGVAVEIRGVSFRFPAGSTLLNELTLSIPSGEMIALAGPSASGKSTLLDLLFGLRQPDQGHILFDQEDLRSLNLGSLRNQVHLVRGVEVIAGTISQNLQSGRQPTPPEVRTTLKAVGLLEEFMRLPAGLETPLQPSGAPLSESQVQRLMLARALLARPRLLLIDQSLDRLSDDLLPKIVAALKLHQPECTIVIATGRREIAQPCSRVHAIGPPPWEETVPDEFSVAG
jgi:putative ABC transport system ATP-binding protein